MTPNACGGTSPRIYGRKVHASKLIAAVEKAGYAAKLKEEAK